MTTNGLAGLPTAASPWTQDFEFVRGEYNISGEQVPYYSTAMTVKDALNYLTLARDLALSSDEPVNVEELMQREVNEARATREIVNYLRQTSSIKFFNSLTVVLAPTDDEHRPLASFPSEPSEPPSDAGDGTNMTPTPIGPVLIRRLNDSSVGYIRWQTNLTNAVIIDGQHRWLALRTFSQEYPGLLNVEQTRLPVLLLVLDPRAGYTPPPGGPDNLIKASRAIFTDINKYAVKVTAEREYLLDDQSLLAVSMRSIITSAVGKTSDVTTESGKRLPLAVIDWNRSGQTKFEDGLYITTLQSLHQLTTEVIGYRQPDGTDYAKTAKWLETITARLELVNNPTWNLRSMLNGVTKAEEDDRPFGLADEQVATAGRAFQASIGQVIVKSLSRMTPYAELIGEYTNAGFLGGERELWLGQTASGRKKYRVQFADDPEDAAKALAKQVKERFPLAYQVVFQRGFVAAASQVDQHRVALAEVWGLATADRTTVLERWIDVFNDIMVPQLIATDLWLGTAIGLDRRIDYKQTAKNAIMGLCLLATTADLEIGTEPESKTEVRRALVGSSSDFELIDRDPLRLPNPTAVERDGASRWSAALNTLRPGRLAADAEPIRPLIKTAATSYRAGVRRYVEQLAAQAGRELSKEELAMLIHAHGARRLAALTPAT